MTGPIIKAAYRPHWWKIVFKDVQRLVQIRRHMHFKQAIRPAILPDGLPVDTVTWKMLRKDVKLSFLAEDNVTLVPDKVIEGLELVPLKANFTEVDYKVVRKQSHLLYHHRLSLLVQRVNYLKTVKITKREKYLQIKSNPPPLIISWGTNRNTGYLRGLVQHDDKFIFVLHPMIFQIKYFRGFQQRKCEHIASELGIDLERVLKLMFSLPCFMMNRSVAEASGIQFLFVHKFLLSPTYSFDDHTAKMYPPIFNSASSGKDYRELINGSTTNDAKFYLRDVLNTNYPCSNGKGDLEDLTQFLLESRLDESYQLRSRGINKKIAHYY